MTLGEQRVRTEFNPSQTDAVAQIKQKTAELKKYLQRCHQDLLIPGNFSQIATKILRREASEADGGWSDSDWLNGADGSVKRYVPLHSSLRRIVAEIISGKG